MFYCLPVQRSDRPAQQVQDILVVRVLPRSGLWRHFECVCCFSLRKERWNGKLEEVRGETLGKLTVTLSGLFNGLNGFGSICYGRVAKLPGHDHVESFLHPRTRLDGEGFGKVGTLEERLERVCVKDFELGKVRKK